MYVRQCKYVLVIEMFVFGNYDPLSIDLLLHLNVPLYKNVCLNRLMILSYNVKFVKIYPFKLHICTTSYLCTCM